MSATQFSPMQQLKRRLYAMRNGAVADTLRRSGCPYRLIFGVNLPQLGEIAAAFGPSEELAEALWRDTDLRESGLLAPMLYPVEKLTLERARTLAGAVRWSEDADILCFKLLRHADFAPQLAAELSAAAEPLSRYAGLRLWFNLVARYPSEALAAARAELGRPQPIAQLAAMLAEEAELLGGE